MALKLLALELHQQGIPLSDIARAAGTHRQAVRRWVYEEEAMPANGRGEEVFRRLLALRDEHRRAEEKILIAMLKSKRALGPAALAKAAGLPPRRVRACLESLIRRGLVRSSLFRTFSLTPEGVAEARWANSQGDVRFLP